MRLTRTLIPLLLALTVALPAVAEECTDVAGADHPQVPRYDGTCLIAYLERA
ncbi:hypothetical protein Q6D67_01270 [Haliea sp. E1-2-M8]|uniref:hypothetical protein n=1 Tax=Haliea sp. E1-2-M8 TaxID=3064706 RepID=UPI00271BB126|nr:hypothetical protein [Haliea sp. E1-2-M8]MDO8860314.1 hypothetical protein [Haliea sp. E1-2-M8]